MRLTISHITEYAYGTPVSYALQRLRLTPVTTVGQTVLSWSTTVEGGAQQVSYDDHFGNRVELMSIEGERDAIRIVASGEVETEDRAGVFGPHQSFMPLWLFLRDTALTKRTKAVRDLAKSVVQGDSDLSAMHALMGTVHQTIAFVPGETGICTSADEALEKRSGVCQDHAHVMIAAARALAIPARYVSGYLLTESGAQQAASHAWAEMYLKGLGWVGFDAANNLCPDARYVRVATGLDYMDAAPISGLVQGAGSETLTVSLTVSDSGQWQSQS
ncbi:transglutaminase [Rhizobium rhizosphaerae]|uniref:Transglutaminase n=1 Tax=Xaviernesmea rhizosphaerae TaxID=1672749 RepID=A0A1Q9AGN2_9HYPH|nr:transglutaminase family protein [Xaviernesmea rhizosphaerae]OLP54335.1 transglutaminase [Xaviernesmea rhizosphaerae]